ncbi:hypothetical protein BCR42DRAFT_384537 [Absidia repens]|uniref:PH domain-containing protein n=1 Tax=Absidia repens TaxID=90262 RepID=A0A1X2HYG8_9FUNG|nr:hypothetical protein BCR42DRAFT_384537 [Absidia repens]
MAELETVIGTHNFEAQNGDELSFQINEIIIVLEKDEGYQDGWWQGRNARGEIGLFPMNYTAPTKPPTLHTLEDKIDSLETAVTQMHLPKEKGGLPTPSISTSSHQSSQPLPHHISSSSSTSSIQPSATSSTPASYQKKLSSKYVHQSVANSLQNPELQACLPEDWSVEQVGTWLGLMGFSDIASTFQDQEITGDILLELNVDSLKELNVATFGKRFKIYNAIKVLSDENVARKEVPDTTSDNNSTHHSSSPAQSITSTPSSRPPPPHIPYADDDLISDYSTVIRNSTTTTQVDPSTISTSSATLTTTNASASTERTDPRRMFSLDSARPLMSMDTPQTFGANSPPSRSATPLNRALSTQQQYQPNDGTDRVMNRMNPGRSVHNSITNTQFGATATTQAPNLSHSATDPQQHSLGRSSTLPSHHHSPLTAAAASTVNPSSSNGGNRSRYNFVRNSFLSPVKPQTALPVASRASMDGIAQRLGNNKENVLPDMEGWLHKQGDKYKTWNKRWFVLKGSNLFYFKSPKDIRMKGIINLRGYRIVTDETIHAGKFCFRAQHDRERTFYFYTDTEKSMKEWMKPLIKATITRDFTAPVMSSSTIPTVSLDAARRMRPRPPSTVYGPDADPERPSSPSLYDSRPFSLTYTNQAEPIMRMSMSDETSDMFSLNNQTQESGLVRREPPAPPIRSLSSSASSMETSSLYQDSGFNANTHRQQQPQQQQSSAMFYHDEDEDLIDPHQRSPSQQTNLNIDPVSPLLHHNHINNTTNDKDCNNRSPVDTHQIHPPPVPPSSSSSSSSGSSSTSPRQRQQQQQRHQPYPYHDRIEEQKEEEEDEDVDNNKAHQQPLLSSPSSSTTVQHQDRNNGDTGERHSWQWDAADYVDWMNQHMDQRKINHVTDIRTGEPLVELLEGISGKQVRRPATTARVGSGPLTSMQMLDNIVAGFKFMGREGVVVDGRYNIKDIFSGNETKIMEMLRTIKEWADQLHPSTDKMASGGTFGEEEQGKLKALDES